MKNKLVKVSLIESKNNEDDKTIEKIVKTITDNKEDLKGKIEFNFIKESEISDDTDLYLANYKIVNNVDVKHFSKLSGKTILFFENGLNADVIGCAQELSGFGVFPVDRFYGSRKEYSEIARFEETLKNILREKISERVPEYEQYKNIDWKINYEREASDKTLTLFSDKAIRKTFALTNRIINDLKPYVNYIDSLTKKFQIVRLLKLEGINNDSYENIVKIYRHINNEIRKSKIRTLRSILITGPTGSGKTLLTKYIKKKLYSYESEDHLTRVPLVNVTDNLIEGELFGTFPGAFTDSRYKVGKLLANAGKIVFLDEVGELSPKVQSKLLTYLDDMRIFPEGYSDPEGIKAPTLIIAATNRNLKEEIQTGSFRADLYHRFNYKISVPSLKKRMDDFRYIVSFIIQNNLSETSKIEKISLRAIGKLENHDYPGNFRQLESVIISAINNAEFAQRDIILERDIDF